jgi:hypothetical protein
MQPNGNIRTSPRRKLVFAIAVLLAVMRTAQRTTTRAQSVALVTVFRTSVARWRRAEPSNPLSARTRSIHIAHPAIRSREHVFLRDLHGIARDAKSLERA